MENVKYILKRNNKMTGYASIDNPHEKGFSFFQKNPIIPNINIYSALKLISLPYINEQAINCIDLNITFKQLLNNSKILSNGFKELGIKKGDIITCSMPNFYQGIITFLAANRIGAVTTFLNYNAQSDEINHYLNLFESPLFINYNKSLEYNESIKQNTSVRQIITLYKEELNKKDFKDYKKDNIGYSDFISFSDMKLISDYYHGFTNSIFGLKNNSLILFTSGSTGNPKSVVLTNENILASGIYMKNSTGIKNTLGEKSLVCVPFCYPYGFATSTLMSLLCGREAILAPNLSADNINYYLDKKPNIVFGSPALLELIKRNTSDKQDLSSINTFISGGDFLTPSQSIEGKEFFKNHGANVEICNGSGNAESVGANTNSVGIINKPETVGKILVGSKAIVIDCETNKELKYGKEGLLCISGKHVFKEYYGEEELTKESIIEFNGKKYLKTGTRGFLDKDGYFTLTGRDSRYYIMSTLNKVYCDQLQRIISAIDCIDSCAVVKKPDDELLYTNKVFIVLKNDYLPNEETLNYIKKMCLKEIIINSSGEKGQLKPYEIPSSFEFVDSLPRTRADKVDYTLLEDLAKEEYEKNNRKKLLMK